MKRVLLLGGTGAMGSHLANELSNKGAKIFITTRKSRKNLHNLEYLKGNAMDPLFIDDVLSRKWDAIVDFMNYKTTQFVHLAPKLLSSTSQYIYLSSARVYAESNERITETYVRLLDQSKDPEFLSTDDYSLAKARQENYLIRADQANWTIIRPYITYGERRLQLGPLEKEAWLYRALKGRTIVFSREMLNKLTTMTYGLDVARAIADIVGEKRAFGEIFQVTSDKSYSWEDVLQVYLNILENILGFRPKVLLLEGEEFMKCRPSKYQIIYDRLYNRTFDNSKIASFSNISDNDCIEIGLARCVRDFVACPNFDPIDWRREAIKDRFTGEHASFSEMNSWKDYAKYLLCRYIKK